MANVVIMPKQGQSVESCTITKWYKQVGDNVEKGDLLFSYETDKAAFDEESAFAGKLLTILAEEGEDVPCLSNVCVIGREGEDISSLMESQIIVSDEPGLLQKNKNPLSVAKSSSAEPSSAEHIIEDGGRAFVSPRARMAAQRQGEDPLLAVPTGPGGRIVERDIYTLTAQIEEELPKDDLVDAGALYIAFTDKKLSGVRKATAKAMHHSLSSMAQLTHHSSFNAAQILEFRKQVKLANAKKSMDDITLNDIVLFAVARVLKDHSALNAHFLEDKIRLFHEVNLGIAVDTERGLLVPVLFGADRLSLCDIAKQSKRLIAAARSGRIDPELLTNGTFTVTNLGSLGVEGFTPVINPPQTAILGVCSIVSRIRETQQGLEAYPAMGLSLTYDHRAVDGAPAARFMQELGRTLENFYMMLAR